ncbi:unnamed protein product [Ceutorhynchus assimilis]|uniref:DUF4780 domain-containing protein n=1 Tax=Ceutorhynchus assimilis TaxID=467358 RepID=A0A9N9MG30_9CUCU|nr:unnamed protein product [Ceutorhynchus assimilis]
MKHRPPPDAKAHRSKPGVMGGNERRCGLKRNRSERSPRATLKMRPEVVMGAAFPKAAPAHGSYSQATKNHLRVAIIDRQDPLGKLTAEQAGAVQSNLEGLLDKAVQENLQRGLNVEDISHSGEILRIICGDGESLEWLKGAVKQIPVLLEGAQLEVVQADDLSTLAKANLWIPEKPEEKGLVLA